MCAPDARGALLCYEALAELQVFLGDARGARGTIATALRSRRPNGRFLRVAGLIEKRLGDLDAAAGLLKRSVAVDPRDYKSWLAVRTGRHLAMAGPAFEHTQSTHCIKSMLSVLSIVGPVRHSHARIVVTLVVIKHLGQLSGLVMLDDMPESLLTAVTAVTAVIAADFCVGGLVSHVQLAVLERRAGDHAAAARAFQRGSACAPRNPHIWYLWGAMMWREVHDHRAARRLFERATDYCPRCAHPVFECS